MERAGIPVEATAPPYPETFGYLLDYWQELASARPPGLSGAAPISYVEIKAWAELTGREILPVEVRLLRALDGVFLRVMNG